MEETKRREPGEINEVRLAELIRLINERKISPKNLFIVGKTIYMIIGQGHIERGMSKEEYDLIVPRNFDRGEILNSFSKIEFFINELIRAVIMENPNDSRNDSLDALLDKLEFYSKFRILSDDLKIIDRKGELYQKILNIKDVRNAIAHLWSIDRVYYKNADNGSLEDNFKEFQEDLKLIWKELIRTYENLVNQDLLIETTIEEIKEFSEDNKSTKIHIEEYNRIIDAVKQDYAKLKGFRKESRKRHLVAMVLAAESGLRPGEIVSLQKSQVENNFILVGNEEGERKLPIPKSIDMEMVRSVIPLGIEKRALQKTIQSYGKEILKKNGITLQGLRTHCFLEMLQKKGTPMIEIKKLLGISSWSGIESYI